MFFILLSVLATWMYICQILFIATCQSLLICVYICYFIMICPSLVFFVVNSTFGSQHFLHPKFDVCCQLKTLSHYARKYLLLFNFLSLLLKPQLYALGWRRSKGAYFRINSLGDFSPNSFCVFGERTYLHVSIPGLKCLISRSTKSYLSKFISGVKTQNITIHSSPYPTEKLHCNNKSLCLKDILTLRGAGTLADFQIPRPMKEPSRRGGYRSCPVGQPSLFPPLKSSLNQVNKHSICT